jgi:hypothetical protein
MDYFIPICPICAPEAWAKSVGDKTVNEPLGKLTWEQARAFLQSIKDGVITLEVVGPTPQQLYCGHVRYLASNGWQIEVFNDCGEYDYIQDISNVEGLWIDYKELYWEEEVGLADHNEAMKSHQDASFFDPNEFDKKALAIWHWEE